MFTCTLHLDTLIDTFILKLSHTYVFKKRLINININKIVKRKKTKKKQRFFFYKIIQLQHNKYDLSIHGTDTETTLQSFRDTSCWQLLEKQLDLHNSNIISSHFLMQLDSVIGKQENMFNVLPFGGKKVMRAFFFSSL